MTSISVVVELMYEYTYHEKDYFKAVIRTQPFVECMHKHESRKLAFLCFIKEHPNYFGKITGSIEELTYNWM